MEGQLRANLNVTWQGSASRESFRGLHMDPAHPSTWLKEAVAGKVSLKLTSYNQCKVQLCISSSLDNTLA